MAAALTRVALFLLPISWPLFDYNICWLRLLSLLLFFCNITDEAVSPPTIRAIRDALKMRLGDLDVRYLLLAATVAAVEVTPLELVVTGKSCCSVSFRGYYCCIVTLDAAGFYC